MSLRAKPANPLRRAVTAIRNIRERHGERNRPTGFHFALADRVNFLNGEAWDQVAQGSSVFLRREVLRAFERTGPKNIAPRYVILYRDNVPVAVIAAQIVTLTGKQLELDDVIAKRAKTPAFFKRALSPAAKMATAKLDERLLVAGNIMSWGFHGIAFAAGKDPAQLWPGVAEALYRIRRSDRLLGQANIVMVKDITERQSGLEALRRFSYRPLETEPNMVLEINPAWRNYDDYLLALDAKYRRNAKDQIKKLAAGGCVLERLADLRADAGRLHELYLNVHANAPLRWFTLPEDFLPSLAAALGDDFRCTVVRRGEEILGFVTTLRDGPTAIAYYIGFDRAAAAEGLPIYLRLLHATIGDAISWGCTRLSLGRTALEPKASMGAKPEPLSFWLRHRISSVNWMFRGLLDVVPHGEAPERNPFKTTGSQSGSPLP